MANYKITTYVDEDLLEWVKTVRLLTGTPMPDLWNRAIQLLRDEMRGEEIGCRDPDSGRMFVKVAGEDFPMRDQTIELKGGRPPVG